MINERCSKCGDSLENKEYFVNKERKAMCIGCSPIHDYWKTGAWKEVYDDDIWDEEE